MSLSDDDAPLKMFHTQFSILHCVHVCCQKGKKITVAVYMQSIYCSVVLRVWDTAILTSFKRPVYVDSKGFL